VNFTYHGLEHKPMIIAAVVDPNTGEQFGCKMILDTGCHKTSFPAILASRFGHNNDHPDVVKGIGCTLGGDCHFYTHTVKIGLLDESEPVAEDGKAIIRWLSKSDSADFIAEFKSEYGIIGRDIMREWKSVEFSDMDKPRPKIQIVT